MNPDLKKLVITKSSTLRDAMAAIDAGAVEIALVVDESARLVATVTDGDIRRALLAGESIDGPVSGCMNPNFAAVEAGTGRAEVLDLMRARSLAQIPVLDAAGRLMGLHLLREMLGASSRKNCAVIMAGGRGERLRPITDTLPKPMVRVAGRPILERLVLHLVGFGITTIYLSVNYKAEVIERHFGDGRGFGCSIEYLREEKPLGTGGALSLLPRLLQDPVVVLNGDLLTQVDVGSMLEFHASGGFMATVAVHDYVHTVPYGVVDCVGNRITGLREKPVQSWRANAGMYVLDPDLIDRIPKETYFPLPALVEECLDRGEAVGAYRVEDDWLDIGRPQELLRARGEGDAV